MPECPDCERRFTGKVCHVCGWKVPEARETRQHRMACDCGAGLLASGLCSAAGGYPGTSSCPHTCPICRGALDWDGGCQRCHGCTTGKREDWTFPGDRYEFQKGHWQQVDGPRNACTPEQNAAGVAAIRTLLGFDITRPDAARTRFGPIDPAVRSKLERQP